MARLRRHTFVLLILAAVVITSLLPAQETAKTEQEQARNYPDFALQAPPINTSPGPEYASWTRVYQGIAGIERMPEGRLWAAWTAGGPGQGPWNYVVLVTSGDDGKSWSEPRMVIDPPGNVLAWLPSLWADSEGRLWLFWEQVYGEWDGRGGVWAIVSENAGSETPTWSMPRRLADGRAINKPIVLTTGEWLLPVTVRPDDCQLPRINEEYTLGLTAPVIKVLCHDLGDKRGAAIVYSSVDRGKTWNVVGQARVPETQVGDPMLVERKDGSLWMLVRTFYGIGQSISADRGKTWEQSGPSGIRHPATRFFIRRLKSGSLLMVRHNPPTGEVRSHLTAYLSDDDGRSWYGELLLDERLPVSYPDGAEADNGTIYVIYDHNRGFFADTTAGPEILLAAFTEEDVKQGKCATDNCRLKVLVNKAGE